jgi:AAA domain/Primase C terminal 2 (PriCT-2)
MTDELPPKPQTYNGDLTELPPALSHLREQKVWLCWCWFWNGKKWTKPPRRVDNPERNASSSDPATWGSYEEAVEQVRAGRANGIGFALKGLNIGGVDLDHCRDPATGVIDPWAEERLAQFPDTYVEATVSGKGLRILGTSSLDSFAPKFKLQTNGAAIELFSNSNHYLTLSCNALRHCAELPPIGDKMLAVAAELGGGFDFNAAPPDLPHVNDAPQVAPPLERMGPQTPWSFAEETRLRAALSAIPTDEKLLAEKFGHAHDTWVKIGRAIERLGWGDRGLLIWRDWSAQNAGEFDEKGLRTQWASFERNRGARENPTTVATVFYYAIKFGWNGDVEVAPEDAPEDAPSIQIHWHGDVDPLESRPQLINKLLPETGTGLASGQWGTYKTFVVIDIATSVMSGVKFIDFAVVRKGGVLFIAPEGSSELPARIEAAIKAKCPEMGRAPFAWIETCPALINPKTSTALAAIAQQVANKIKAKWNLPLALIVIDTVVVSAGYDREGQDNDTAVGQRIMSTMAELSKATGAFVLGVDHFGKSVETGTRGTSAKEGAADVVLALLGERTVAGAVTDTRLALRKRRSGQNGEEFSFTIRVVELGTDRFGEPVTTLTIDWAPQGAKTTIKSKPWSKSLRLLQRTLSTALAELGSQQRPFADGPIVCAVDLEAVRSEFYKSYPADGAEKQKQAARRQAFNRAIRDAQAGNLIAIRAVDGVTLIWLAAGEP